MNKIVYSPEAKKDIESIGDYIAYVLKNPIAANKTVDGILDQAEILTDNANIGSPAYLQDGKFSGYRYTMYNNYYLFYKTSGNVVYIHRVLNARQDYLRILFK